MSAIHPSGNGHADGVRGREMRREHTGIVRPVQPPGQPAPTALRAGLQAVAGRRRASSQTMAELTRRTGATTPRLTAFQPRKWCRAPEENEAMVTMPKTRKSLMAWVLARSSGR